MYKIFINCNNQPAFSLLSADWLPWLFTVFDVPGHPSFHDIRISNILTVRLAFEFWIFALLSHYSGWKRIFGNAIINRKRRREIEHRIFEIWWTAKFEYQTNLNTWTTLKGMEGSNNSLTAIPHRLKQTYLSFESYKYYNHKTCTSRTPYGQITQPK